MKKLLLCAVLLSTMLVAATGSAFADWNLWSVGGTASITGTTVTLSGGASDVQNWTKTDGTNPAGKFVKSFLTTSDFNGQTVNAISALDVFKWSNVVNSEPNRSIQPFINIFVKKTVAGTDYYCILASMTQDGVKNLDSITWKTYEPGKYVDGSWVSATAAQCGWTAGAYIGWNDIKDLTLATNGWLNWKPSSMDTSAFNNDAFRIAYGDSAGSTNYPGNVSFTFSGNVVPEPSSILVLLGGMGSLLAFRRRRA